MSKTKKVQKKKDPQMDIRPQVSREDFEAFRSACKANGETMTSLVRRFIMKVARGDKELLDRIVT